MNPPEDLSEWIGRQTQVATDQITPRMVDSFAATFHPHFHANQPVPPGIHWCLCPTLEPAHNLGADGHPTKGAMLPPVSLPRRMWAGGKITTLAPFAVGDVVTRTTSIQNIIWKTGASGALCFVTVAHEFATPRGTAIQELHDIVYRGDGPVRPAEAAQDTAAFDLEWQVRVTPTMLFRYSALMFNGHRIHYDLRYAQQTEGYDDLVIHGPLQATMLLNLAASHLGQVPRHFRYRALAPATGAQNMRFGLSADDGGGALVAQTEAGGQTMHATALLR